MVVKGSEFINKISKIVKEIVKKPQYVDITDFDCQVILKYFNFATDKDYEYEYIFCIVNDKYIVNDTRITIENICDIVKNEFGEDVEDIVLILKTDDNNEDFELCWLKLK